MPPNPDLRAYIDLTIYDKDSQTLYEEFAQNMALTFPDWVPREGNTEVVMAEAIAFILSEATFAINRLPNSIVEVLLQFYGVYRDLGVQPVYNLEFTVTDGAGYTIPAGTSALLSIVDGIDPVVFSTDDELVIPPASTSGITSATGDRFTVDANGIVSGTALALVDTLQFVEGVTVDSAVTNGRDQEDDSAWITRGTQRLTELSQALVLPRQFQAYALENPEVNRALAVDNYHAPSGTPGSDGGYISVAVYGDGAVVSAGTKTQLALDMNAKAQANLNAIVYDATIKTLAVTTTVVAQLGADHTVVQNNVIQALQDYLSLDTWNWDKVVRKNNLIGVVGNADGVAYVSTMTAPAGDTTYTEAAPLVQAGVLSVTVS